MNDQQKEDAQLEKQKAQAQAINKESVRAFQIFDSLPEDQQAKLIELGQERAEESLTRMVDAIKRASEAAQAPPGYALVLIKRLFGESGGKDPNDPVFKKTWDNALRLGITVVMNEQGLLRDDRPKVWKPDPKKLIPMKGHGLSEKARRLLGKKTGTVNPMTQDSISPEVRDKIQGFLDRMKGREVEHKLTIEPTFKNDAVPRSMVVDTRPETQAAARAAIAAGAPTPISIDYLRRIASYKARNVFFERSAIPEVVDMELLDRGFVEHFGPDSISQKVIMITATGLAFLEQHDTNMAVIVKKRIDEMQSDLGLTPEQKAALETPAAKAWFEKAAEAVLTPNPNAPDYGPPKWLEKLQERTGFALPKVLEPGGPSYPITEKIALVKDLLTEQAVTIEEKETKKQIGILDHKDPCQRSLSGMHWWDDSQGKCKNCGHERTPS